jgi:hypothetical protein
MQSLKDFVDERYKCSLTKVEGGATHAYNSQMMANSSS